MMKAGILVLVLCMCIAGCLQETPGSSPTVQGSAPPVRSPQPTVLIASPAFDGGVLSGNVTVVVLVSGITLIPPGSGSRSGTGRLIYYRDVVPPVTPGLPAFSLPGTYAVSAGTVFTWTGVTPGTHTFAVQLVHPDDSPFDPPVIDAVDVTAVDPGTIVRP